MSLLSQALFSAQSSDNNVRTAGKQALDEFSHSNPVEYLVNLSLEMSKTTSPPQVRQLAGLLIKNLVNNLTNDPSLERVWDRVDPQVKTQIRNNTLGTLASEDKEVRLICSQTVAALACIDIPQGQWTEVLGILITNSTNVNPIFKISAIRTLGYICEGLPQRSVVKEQADQILTALASSLESGEKDLETKFVALSAFRNALKFISANISNQAERGIILNLLYGCCQDTEARIRSESMMIICDVLSLYYDFLETNLVELGNLTYSIIKNDHSAVAIFAIEFWNQAADEEAERIRYGEKPCKNYIAMAAASLVPLLLEKIHLVDQDNDEWNMHKACACTLGSISLIVHDQILELVGNYITVEIKSEVWEKRVSAAVIIGSIMEGVKNVQVLIQYTLQDLLNLLNDQVLYVKQTAAWSLSKLCETHSEFLIRNNFFNTIVAEAIKSLESEPKVATHSCWTIMNFFHKEIPNSSLTEDLTLFIIENLIKTSMRPDAHGTEHDLLLAAYSAINKIIEEIPEQFLPAIVSKLDFFIGVLEGTSSQQAPIQSHVCSALHSLFGRSAHGCISNQIADKYVAIIVQIFKNRGTVIEEGLQALGTLADNMGARFETYMPILMPFIEWSIDMASGAVSKSGVMCAGDFARAIGINFSPYINRILPKILVILSNEQIAFDVKVRAIETLSDFASHTTKELSTYLQNVLVYIESASGLSIDFTMEQNNPDMHEYLTDLREAIICFYIGVLQGLNDIKEGDKVFGYLPKIVDYAMMIVQDVFKPNTNIHTSVVGIIGDIASYYQGKSASFLKTNKIDQYLTDISHSTNEEILNTVGYAREKISLI